MKTVDYESTANPTTEAELVASGLYLVRQTVPQQSKKVTKEAPPTNHLVVLDCSGSMSGELPRIREQLKRKVPKLLKEQDTLSVIWFSGRGEFGTLLEGEPVASLKDLKDIEQAIDRWVRPVGLTGFKEPLEEVQRLVTRLKKARPNNVCSLFFMSDGCDNTWSRPEILKAIDKAADGLSMATFVEYGYYADRPLLTTMAEKAGGSLIFSENFDKYAPQFEGVLQKKVMGAAKVELQLSGDVVGGFAYCLQDQEIVTFSVEGDKVLVPENTGSVWYLSSSPSTAYKRGLQNFLDPKLSGFPKREEWLSAAYAAVSLFAVRMKPDVVFPLLKCTGDVQFIEQFSSCFGKQRYSDFMVDSKEAAFNSSLRLKAGYDPNKVPRDDAFTVLDLLQILQEDEGNRLLLDSPDFRYSAVGRGRVQADDVLTEEEQQEIKELTSKMASTKNPKQVKAMAERVAELTANKGNGLKFEALPAPDGYPLMSLTFNEDRPNISVLVRKPGTVKLDASKPSQLPETLDTFVWRNYTIVKDGLVNVDVLPCKVTAKTLKELAAVYPDLPTPEVGGGCNVKFYLRSLPVINRQMITEVSAKSFFEKKYRLQELKAAQKVYNSYTKDLVPPKKSTGLAVQYGDEAATWLKEQGVTDGGFSPKTVQAESTDFYRGKELKASLKGLSTLPSLKEAKEKLTKGKPNAPTLLMKPTIEAVEAFLGGSTYLGAGDKEAFLTTWLEQQGKATTNAVRELIFEIAKMTFCLVVGQTWFKEFSSLDESTFTLDIGKGQSVECKVEMKEIEVKI